jgi:hypothetical protein
MTIVTAAKALATRILAALGFYVLVSPIACLLRIFYDPLSMKWDSAALSYRVIPKRGYRPDLSRMS